MRYSALVLPFLASLLGLAATSELPSDSKISSASTIATVATQKGSVQRKNIKTGLGLKKSSSSESKIAKDVLESSGEGYCSVSQLGFQQFRSMQS
jgi:hypothetical protein